MKTDIFHISTGMGTTNQWANAGLNEAQSKALNDIGYSGKFNGVRMTRQTYFDQHVNNKKLNYTIQQTKWDRGDFAEAFILTRTTA